MVRLPEVPKGLAAYSAGLLLAFGLIVLALAFLQAFAGGALVREAVQSGAMSPRAGLLAALAMASYLCWHSLRAVRGIKIAAQFK